MEIKVNRQEFLSKAQALEKITPRRGASPILGDILLNVGDGECVMTASDTEITLELRCRCEETEGTGRVCIKAVDFISALSPLNDEEVSIRVADDGLSMDIVHRLGLIHLSCDNSEDYPMPARAVYDDSHEVDADFVKNAIKNSMWATSNDALREVLNGLYFNACDGCLDVVGSDGHSLVRNRADYSGQNFSVLLSAKVCNVIQPMIASQDKLTICLGVDGCRLVQTSFTLDVRLKGGRYPAYNRVLDQRTDIELSVDRQLMHYAIQNAMQFADASMSRLLVMELKDGNITLEGANSNYGNSSRVSIPVDYSGKSVRIGVQGASILNIFGKMSADKLTVRMSASDRPVFIEQGNVVMLTMPILLS